MATSKVKIKQLAPVKESEKGKYLKADKDTGEIKLEHLGIVDDDLECVILNINT